MYTREELLEGLTIAPLQALFCLVFDTLNGGDELSRAFSEHASPRWADTILHTSWYSSAGGNDKWRCPAELQNHHATELARWTFEAGYPEEATIVAGILRRLGYWEET